MNQTKLSDPTVAEATSSPFDRKERAISYASGVFGRKQNSQNRRTCTIFT